MMSSTTTRGQVNSMAAVCIDPHSLALGAKYKILQFVVVECTVVQYCFTPRTHFLVAGGIKEVVNWL